MVKGFLAPFIWCLLLFNIMAVIIDIFSFIDDIVKYKIPASSIAAFYVYYIPTIFIQVAPMAVLLACMYFLSNLNKHSEITAMRSSGISIWRLLAPIILIGFIISAIVFIVNDKVIPISSRVSTAIRHDELEKAKYAESRASGVVENVAIYGSDNRIIFARRYNMEKKELEDIIMHEHDAHENLTAKITAASAEWTGSRWRFAKVIIYKIDNSGRIIGQPTFYGRKVIPLKERPGDFANREWKSDFLSYRQLKKYIRNFGGTDSRLTRSLLVDLHYKIAFCFISVIVILIGSPFALITTRGGVLIGMGLSIGIGLLYYSSIAVFIAFGKAGLLPPIIAAWLGNILFLGIGIHLVNKRL